MTTLREEIIKLLKEKPMTSVELAKSIGYDSADTIIRQTLESMRRWGDVGRRMLTPEERRKHYHNTTWLYFLKEGGGLKQC